MLKAGQMFYHRGSLFALKYDAAEIKGTLVEGLQYSPSNLPYNAQALVQDLVPYNFMPPKPAETSTLEYNLKVKADTSELVAVIAKLDLTITKLEKLQKLQAGTQAQKVWTKDDLYVGLTFPYLYPYNNCEYFYKITGFIGDKVIVDDCDSTGKIHKQGYKLTIKEALERLKQKTK